MAERINLPPFLRGTTEDKLQQLRSYLYQLATVLNMNQQLAGSEAVTLTDEEQILMNSISGSSNETETLKGMIIKTAQTVRTMQKTYNTIIYGEESAQNDFGAWNRQKGIRVIDKEDGSKKTYSITEIINLLKNNDLGENSRISTGTMLARTISGSEAEAAEITVSRLKVTGEIETPGPQVIISSTAPQDVHDTIWLEPAAGEELYRTQQKVEDGTAGGWTYKGESGEWYIWEQTCLLNDAEDAEGLARIRISGSLYRDGTEESASLKLTAKVNLTGSATTEIDLGEVRSIPADNPLKWQYGFEGEADVSEAIEQGAEIESVTFQLMTDTEDDAADDSYTNNVKVTLTGSRGAGLTDECTVHYIP